MRKSKKYLRLSRDEKNFLIDRALKGESVSLISKEAGISRTIFYKWLKEYSKKSKRYENQEHEQEAKKKKHWRKQKISIERLIIRLWLNNPELSIREVAKKTGVSTGGAFNVISRYKLQIQREGKKLKRYKKRSYKIFSSTDKLSLIERYRQGESITALSKEADVSRTIFYKWLKNYAQDESEDVLTRKISRGSKHWRFIPGVRDMVADLVLENPTLSLSQLVKALKSEGKNISRSGLYYVLRSMQLTTPEARLAYVKSLASADYDVRSGSSVQVIFAESFEYLPRFVVFTLFWMLVSVTFFHSISKSVEITGEIAYKITPTITGIVGKTAEKAKKKAVEIFEPVKSDQQMGWGALAANLPEDTIIPGEKSRVGFGVVDSLGNTVCGADIRFSLGKAGNQVATESAGVPSGSCSLQGTENKADYIAVIPAIVEPGEYKLDINARTYEGGKQFERKFIIADGLPFQISRSSYPTRIFPAAKYPVEVNIKANADFQGTISEFLPDGITASNISDRGVLFRKINNPGRIIKWNVDLRQGETYKISYVLHFPQIWPEFYEIGPMELTDRTTGEAVYREGRYWQIVADAL